MDHLDNITLRFKNHWSHDLHDLAERRLTFITIYKFQGNRRSP